MTCNLDFLKLPGAKPIKITELPDGRWRVMAFIKGAAFVRDVATYDDAVGGAFLIGRYKLGLGDFVFTYTDGMRDDG